MWCWLCPFFLVACKTNSQLMERQLGDSSPCRNQVTLAQVQSFIYLHCQVCQVAPRSEDIRIVCFPKPRDPAATPEEVVCLLEKQFIILCISTVTALSFTNQTEEKPRHNQRTWPPCMTQTVNSYSLRMNIQQWCKIHRAGSKIG